MREYEKQGLTYNEYSNIHMYINSHFDKEGVCSNCGTKSERTEWALNKGEKYSKDINSYSEMCVSCHRKLDYSEYTREKLSKRMRNGFLSGEYKPRLPKYTKHNHPTNKAILQICPDTNNIINEFFSISEAARYINGNDKVTSIVNCLKGRSKTAYKFKWEYKNGI